MLRQIPKHRAVQSSRIGPTLDSRTGRQRMASQSLFAEVAALSGDPARASMLHALMDGRALTATELARAAGITPQAASSHLARMTAVGLLAVEKQGRHRYHRLATPSVARMMESIMQVAADLEPDRKRLTVGPRDAALRRARTCYDHFAGQTWRRFGRRTCRARSSRADQRCRHSDRGRRRIPRRDRHRHRTDAGARHEAIGASALSTLPRLERAATPSRRIARSSALLPQHGARLDPPYSRNARRRSHAQR